MLSGINQDEIEQSIFTTTEAFQSLSAQCVPQQPCGKCTNAGGEHALSMQQQGAAPTSGNTFNSEKHMLPSGHWTAPQEVRSPSMHGNKEQTACTRSS